MVLDTIDDQNAVPGGPTAEKNIVTLSYALAFLPY